MSNASFKMIYVLLDGVGDGDMPHPSLNNQTPLEYASTPHLDEITQRGCMGNVVSVGHGISPQSDIAVFNMLGYSFSDGNYVGRGVIEAIGSNIDFREGDLALRGNFASINEDKKIIDRRAGRSILPSESNSVCELIKSSVDLGPGVEFEVVPTIGHRVTARIRYNNHSLSDKISNTDPAYDKINGMGIAKPNVDDLSICRSIPQDDNESSKLSADLVNQLSDKIITVLYNSQINIERNREGKKPINSILFRDAGNRIPDLLPISNRFNLSFASLVDMPVEIGISKVLKMHHYKAGNINDYSLKAKKAIEVLSDHDSVYVHIKGPDEYGHDGDALGKVENIEDIDNRFFGSLLDNSSQYDNMYFVISADHSTPCVLKAHSDHPVPLVVSGKGIENDGSLRFIEKFGMNGNIGGLLGYEVLSTAIDLINKSIL